MPGQDPPIDLRYRAGQMATLWFGLALVMALVCFQAIRGAETTGGRIAGGLFGGVLAAGFGFLGVDARRHPQYLRVDEQQIVHGYRGKPKETVLSRDHGTVVRLSMQRLNRSATWYLRQDGVEMPILLQAFHPAEVRQACESKGWTVLDG